MVNVKEDLTGKTFGLWTVLKRADDIFYPNEKHGNKIGRYRAAWVCQCGCENKTIRIVVGESLTKKNGSRSCGCIGQEKAFAVNKKYNKYDLSGEFGIGYIPNTDEVFYFDLEDYDKIKDYYWTLHKRNKDSYKELQSRDPIENKIVTIPQIILGKWHDHIDRNPLNNKKSNLRPCDRYENAHNASLRKDNKSGVTGVYFDKTNACWKALIMYHNKNINLGSFSNKKDAIVARLNAEIRYFKEFAPQKHLFEQYGVKYEGCDKDES